MSSSASELQDIRIARTAHSEAAPSWASLAAELEPELKSATGLSRRMSSADLNTLEISSAKAMASISLQCCRSEAGLEGLRQRALLLLGQLQASAIEGRLNGVAAAAEARSTALQQALTGAAAAAEAHSSAALLCRSPSQR